MMYFSRSSTWLLVATICFVALGPFTVARAALPGQKMFDEGNFAEAYEVMQRALEKRDVAGDEAARTLSKATQCLQRLNRVEELDALLNQTIEVAADDWRLLAEVADQFRNTEHIGRMVDGEFKRGRGRGRAEILNSYRRDMVRAMQLYDRAVEAATEQNERKQAAGVLFEMARSLHQLHSGQLWRLQSLTDLQELPDYEQGWWYQRGNQSAPVDPEGNPVLYKEPADWQSATNDGERWRWLLAEAVRTDGKFRADELRLRAEFSASQFGTETLRSGGWLPHPQLDDNGQEKSGILSLHTLADDETVARLASGVKRFKLPAEHHYLALNNSLLEVYQQQAYASGAAGAAESLAQIYLNRRQFPQAAKYYRQVLESTPTNSVRKRAQQQLDQITKPWGQFLNETTQPAGQGVEVAFRFRNAESVELSAQTIDVQRLLADIKAYLKSNPSKIDGNRVNLNNLGYQILHQDREKYLGEQVASWKQELDPAELHFDRQTMLTTPLQNAGAYFVTAKVAGGNTCHIVLWVADTAIVRKPLDKQWMYYVADAATGKPIEGATLELFGYRPRRVGNQPNKFVVETSNFAVKTDANGMATVAVDPTHQGDEIKDNRLADNRLDQELQWLATATTENGRLAYLGFSGIWFPSHHDASHDRTSAYVVTDRPVYRPEQTVQFKAWIGRARYDSPLDTSEFAHKAFRVEIYDPKREKVLTETMTAGAYGGIGGEYTLPAGAALGQYQIVIEGQGQGGFRVEEYKKPEFEVTVAAPEDPVALGEKFKATVRANYYFGSPVSSGTVKYKVTRTARTTQWYPPSPWDWLYGPGYWWFESDRSWYPGWERWGCFAPRPSWFPQPQGPPEVVAEGEAALDDEGKFQIEIDTALARELHGDSDHNYAITAEVVDASRRTIVGSGNVLVARRAMEVFVWPDRGHYRVEDTVTANVAVRRPDGKPIVGSGKMRLLKLDYPSTEPGEGALAEPKETEVRQWELATGADGMAELQIKASEAGQFRLAYTFTDKDDRTYEGACLLTIAGEGFDGSEFRFSDLELTPDKKHYAPGETVRLRVSTNRTGGSVLLFVRAASGAYPQPRLLRLDGKTTVFDVNVLSGDAPNFFIEAVTISGAEVHTAVREIAVPPAKRLVNLEVLPSAKAYLPGQEATVKLRLTDAEDKPLSGETVIAVYDKSLEYIAGGSNVGDLREHFWKWRRNHYPRTETSLSRSTGNLVPPQTIGMSQLGLFGYVLPLRAETVEQDHLYLKRRSDMSRRLGRGGGFGGGGRISFGMEMQMADGVAMPLSSVAPAMQMSEESGGGSFGGESELVAPTIRENFADTAFWAAAVETGADGIAEVKFTMPENLTAWEVRVWGMGHGTRVGEGSAEIVTRKNLLVRLQTPRFLVERDEVVISANVHNYLDSEKQVVVRLEMDGKSLQAPSQLEKTITVPAGEDRRVDWRLKAVLEGEATLRAIAQTDEESDAMQLQIPVEVHGFEQVESFTGVIGREGRSEAFEFTIPNKRRPEATQLVVRYTPTLAGAMLDAVPYLIDYPHGCTEQTLNRFLPAVITQRTLARMGIDLEAFAKQPVNEDNTDQVPQPAWQRLAENPVFDQAELDKVVRAGAGRLQDMQLSDGGWGWFSGFGERSSAHTTATVLRGLLVARENDVAIVPGVIERGVEWLTAHQAEQLRRLANWNATGEKIDKQKPAKRYADNLDTLVHLVLTQAGKPNAKMRERLFKDRQQLPPYALAMLGVALHVENEAKSADALQEKLERVVRNLQQYVVTDDENQTAFLNLPGGYWWYWYGSEFEAHAYFLKLLAATEPESRVASGLVKYLLANRKHSTYWNSTRDTALVIEAMADYLQATGEGRPDLEVQVWLDGERRKEVTIMPDKVLQFDGTYSIGGLSLEPGRHTLELRKRGSGRLYWSASLANFTMEDDLRSAGLDVRVERKLFKLTPQTTKELAAGSRGQVVRQRGEKMQRTAITNLASVQSGDLVEVELTLRSKNDYEYLLITDPKAAGFEPVDVRSGYTENELGAYVEYRDKSVNLFLRQLARGERSVSYRLRAETPGQFAALPTVIEAMYAPELRGNSDEIRVNVKERGVE